MKSHAMRTVVLGIFSLLPLMLMAPAAEALTTYYGQRCAATRSPQDAFGDYVRLTQCTIIVPGDFVATGTSLVEVNVKTSCLSTTPRTIRVRVMATSQDGSVWAPILDNLSMTVNTGVFGSGALWTLPATGWGWVRNLIVEFPYSELTPTCVGTVKAHKL